MATMCSRAGHLMQASDEVSELLAELQLTRGEGPGRDVSASRGPVLASGQAAGGPRSGGGL
jgi:hypothetical protein